MEETKEMINYSKLPKGVTGASITDNKQLLYVERRDVYLYNAKALKRIQSLDHSRNGKVTIFHGTGLAALVVPQDGKQYELYVFDQNNPNNIISTCFFPLSYQFENSVVMAQDGTTYFTNKNTVYKWNYHFGSVKIIYEVRDPMYISSLSLKMNQLIISVSSPSFSECHMVLVDCFSGNSSTIVFSDILCEKQINPQYAVFRAYHFMNKIVLFASVDHATHMYQLKKDEGYHVCHNFRIEGEHTISPVVLQDEKRCAILTHRVCRGEVINRLVLYNVETDKYLEQDVNVEAWSQMFDDVNNEIVLFSAEKPLQIAVDHL